MDQEPRITPERLGAESRQVCCGFSCPQITLLVSSALTCLSSPCVSVCLFSFPYNKVSHIELTNWSTLAFER